MGLLNYLIGWRKLGIREGDLVLEVGSGGRPFARSDVLCDMFLEDNVERQEGAFRYSIVADRPTVAGNAECLPFKENTFDFVISAHMLEHLIYPERFLEEAMRVSPRGYIITPSEFCERIIPRHTHLWMVSEGEENCLVLRQKKRANESEVPGLLNEAWMHDKSFRRFFNSRPDLFETRFSWKGKFAYRVERDEENPEWLVKANLGCDSTGLTEGTPPFSQEVVPWKRQARAGAERVTRRWLSRAIRRVHAATTHVDLKSLVACPVCKGKLEEVVDGNLTCVRCRVSYPVRPDGIPILLPEMASPQKR